MFVFFEENICAIVKTVPIKDLRAHGVAYYVLTTLLTFFALIKYIAIIVDAYSIFFYDILKKFFSLSIC